MKPFLLCTSIVASLSVGINHANEFAAAEASASIHGTEALEATLAPITEKDLRRYVTRLASREYEGRGTGDRGERMATAYLAAFFEGLGLQAAGDQDSYFQGFNFPAGMALEGNNELTLTVDEPVGLVRRFQPGEHYQPLSISSAGKLDAGIVFAGFGIDTEDYKSFENLDVSGKWIMVLRGNPAANPELQRFGPLIAKANLAKQLGAAGIIFVKGTNPAISSELVDPTSPVGGQSSILPAITITDRLAASLLTGRSDESGLEALFESYSSGERVAGFPLPYHISAEIGITAKSESGRNVLARLVVGEHPSKEVVIIGAHIDHLGFGNRGGSRAKGEEATKMHVGADDNASGVAVVMELAQLYADKRKNGTLDLKRDIVFAAWSGEEMGLHGSRHFVEAGKDDEPLHPRIAAYLNLDMVGRLAENGLTIHGTDSSKAWPELLNSLPEISEMEVKRSGNPYLPTDATPFYSAGVPILAAFTGVHDDYHTPADTIDKIDFKGLDQVSRYMQAITEAVANREEAPDYVKVERPRRGNAPRVRIGLVPTNRDGNGILVQEVMPNSPSNRAGLKSDDIILSFASKELKNTNDLMSALRNAKAGEEYEIQVKRGEDKITLTLTPEAR